MSTDAHYTSFSIFGCCSLVSEVFLHNSCNIQNVCFFFRINTKNYNKNNFSTVGIPFLTSNENVESFSKIVQ